MSLIVEAGLWVHGNSFFLLLYMLEISINGMSNR